ncbi:MAG: hypothetical protein K2M46_09235 [Lachnospiraceae bacterium]|nr:hypothetical protein [Lachnospiraceae bacterium]
MKVKKKIYRICSFLYYLMAIIWYILAIDGSNFVISISIGTMFSGIGTFMFVISKEEDAKQGDKNMNGYRELPIKNILKEDCTTEPGWCNKHYVIYIDCDGEIRINSNYIIYEDKVKLCQPYDRKLCDSLEEYKCLELSYIEEQAYGAYMDGAR